MAQDSGIVVADASVVLKWQLDDEDCISQATALRDDFYIRGTVTVIAPHLLVYEVVNGIATATRQQRITQDKANKALSNLMALGVKLKKVDTLIVFEMAMRYDVAAYDAAYLALAEVEKCDLWTGDRAFYQAVKGEAPWIKWIGNYKAHTG